MSPFSPPPTNLSAMPPSGETQMEARHQRILGRVVCRHPAPSAQSRAQVGKGQPIGQI